MVLTNLFAEEEERCRCKQTYGYRGGERKGWGELKEEHWYIYTHQPSVKLIASGKLLYSTGSSAQCSVITQRGGLGAGGEAQEGRVYVYIWLIHIAIQQKLTKHCEAIILQ